MAIVKMKRLSVLSYEEYRGELLACLQEFGDVEIESAIKKGKSKGENKLPENLKKALVVFEKYKPKASLQDLKNGMESISLATLETKTSESDWEKVADTLIIMQRDLENMRAKRDEIDSEMSTYDNWRSLDLSQSEMTSLTQSVAETFSLPSEQYENLKEKMSDIAHVETVSQLGGMVFVFLLYLLENKKKVQKALRHFSCQTFTPPQNETPNKRTETLKAEKENLNVKSDEALQTLKETAEQGESLRLAEEYYLNLEQRENAQEQIHYSRFTVFIDGWVPAERAAAVELDLVARVGADNVLVQTSGVENENPSHVPVKLHNNKVVKAFERLPEMYSTPRYNEVDPTPSTAFFYLIFFGMMVGDFGYGLVLFVALGAVRIFLKGNPELREKTDFFYYLSFPIMFWGVVFGSFFSVNLFSLPLLNKIPFTPISPTEDIITVLIISVAFGWIQLTTGLILGIVNNKKRGNFWGMVGDGVSWLCFMFGIAFIVLGKFVLKDFAFGNIVFYIGIGLVTLMPPLILFAYTYPHPSKLKGFAKGLYAVYGVSGYIGDLVSYTRLMALGVSGASIGLAFNTILAQLPLWAKLTIGVVLAILMHSLNLFLSMLSAYVHGIRLQFVEFFGKFFDGGGRKFTPLQGVGKHFRLKKESLDKE